MAVGRATPEWFLAEAPPATPARRRAAFERATPEATRASGPTGPARERSFAATKRATAQMDSCVATTTARAAARPPAARTAINSVGATPSAVSAATRARRRSASCRPAGAPRRAVGPRPPSSPSRPARRKRMPARECRRRGERFTVAPPDSASAPLLTRSGGRTTAPRAISAVARPGASRGASPSRLFAPPRDRDPA
jgi:hypothetical protein